LNDEEVLASLLDLNPFDMIAVEESEGGFGEQRAS